VATPLPVARAVRVIKREVSVPGRILYVDATQVDGVRVLEVRVERSALPVGADDRTRRVTVAGTIGGD
jgi:hypothetical protein